MKQKKHWLNVDLKDWPRTTTKTAYKQIYKWLRIARSKIETIVDKEKTLCEIKKQD